MSGLVADFRVDRGSFSLELELDVAPSTVTAIVGPNGAGKSTALRTLAGLLRPTTGMITSDGRVLDDAASDTHVPAADRRAGVVFQDYLLFPHLSALDNVAFGLVARGSIRREARARAATSLDRFRLAELASRRPARLSGGQAQRVALARALVTAPTLLLLDEPLAALDAEIRTEIRQQLALRLREFDGATVIVTHDPVDALTLADEVVVLEGGRVTQRGTPVEIARSPETEYVAELVGLNLLRRPDGAATVFPPGAVLLSDSPPLTESGMAGIRCRIRGVEYSAGGARVLLAAVDDDQRFAADVSVERLAAWDPTADEVVWASVPLGVC